MRKQTFRFFLYITSSQKAGWEVKVARQKRQNDRWISFLLLRLWNLLGVSSRLLYWLQESQLVPIHRCFQLFGAEGRNLSCRKKMKTHSGSRRLNAGARFRLTHPGSRRGLMLMLQGEKLWKRVNPGSSTSINSCAQTHTKRSDELQVSINEVLETLYALSTN